MTGVWTPAYVGIGSNLQNPQDQVTRGMDALAALPRTQLVARSSLYRSAPLGPQDQPDFINAVAGLSTQLDARALLSHLKALEKDLGRGEPVVRWGPRIIDFDLLVHGSTTIETAEIRVPHPGIADRAFVIVPLQEIAPDLDVPGVGRIENVAARIDASQVQRV
jgi:2-amino-4-hydroxy-6-hydroxymethyldihydropteridine diphosphokinase